MTTIDREGLDRLELRDIRDDQAMLMLDLFLANDCKSSRTADAFTLKMIEHGERTYITREQVYPAFAIALERGFLRVVPPYDHALAQRIVERYGKLGPIERFRVSDVKVSTSRKNLPYVASNAAELVLDLIKLIGKKKQRVHIGLGSGVTSMFIAQNLAQLFRTETGLPKLALHALTAGWDALAPQHSPESFFGMFQQSGLDIEYYGMFAPPFVASNEYERTLQNPAVAVPFAHKHKIDVVATALADAKDPHGCMGRFIALSGRSRPEWAKKVVGDIQYRLFSEKGAVQERRSPRAVTLFELDELRALARRKGKYVVLVSGPCHTCGETREAALRPLMMNDDLKFWSQLVTDLETAEKLVAPR